MANLSLFHFKRIFLTLSLLFTTQSFAGISTTDRCKTALEIMGVDASDTNRGWAALCAGVVTGDTILRYGNWYGPGYWGGDTHLTKAGNKAPIDSLDEIAMRHDYGYVIAEKYGTIYGKAYEYKLKAIADKIAVTESMKLPIDPKKWKNPPKDPIKTARFRDRIITGFIIESDLYKKLGTATEIGGVITSPIITIMDETDYSHIPDMDKLKREVNSHINGWKKDVKKEEEEKKQKEKEAKEKSEKKQKDLDEKSEKEREAKLKKKNDADKAKARLRKKIEESKKETKKKSYDEMTPEERKKALMENDDEAWSAIQKELVGDVSKEEIPTPSTKSDIPIIKLTASGSFEGDYSAGKFKNIVTTTITLSFYNVGSQVSGYGGVSMKSKSVSSLNGSSSENQCGGVFSGGPTGRITLSGNCAGTTVSIQNGTTINAGDATLIVSDPSAFSYWDE